MNTTPKSLQRYVDQLTSAQEQGRLSESAVTNLRVWLTADQYAEYVPAILDHIRHEQWEQLQEFFWTSIPFGTAGRRGRMYPIGCHAINNRTIGETVQALAEHVHASYDGSPPPSCAIAYDTRHRSEEFARLAAEIMVAHGFRVFFFEGFRSTPLLATTILYKKCACGIMVSASHNPPTDNAVKVFWSTGGQLRPPHDVEVTERMNQVTNLRREPFASAVAADRICYVAEEMDKVYRDKVLSEGFGMSQGVRDLNIIYSPLHGVGLTSVLPVLQADGFSAIEVFAPHAEPNGCFPNVPENIANPENPAVFDALIVRARETAADIVLASDPDADRLGCACPLQLGGDQWSPLSGNQIAVLLTDYVLRRRRDAGSLTADHFIVKTLVTTEMLRSVADDYGIKTYGECQTGFKWIGSLIDEKGPEKFVLGAEEAHGYLIGTHARDKDGAVAAMLLAELAAAAKQVGRSLHEELDRLYLKYGYHCEWTVAQQMPGAAGLQDMQAIMQQLRSQPVSTLAGFPVSEQLDYLTGTIYDEQGNSQPFDGPPGNLLIIRLNESGHYVAVRPSGTEPKIKFYFFAKLPPDQSRDLTAARQELDTRIQAIHQDLMSQLELA